VVDLNLAVSPEEAEERGLRILQSLDPLAKVGSVHHTVPRFYLHRFALGERVVTRVPGQDGIVIRNVADMGQRDFYTAIVDADAADRLQNAASAADAGAREVDGAGAKRLDARLEDVLSTMEGLAATVLGRITDQPHVAINAEERYALTTFLAFQMVRGVRARREVELFAEFYAKTMMRQPLHPKARRRVEIEQARRAGRQPARGNGRQLPPKRGARGLLSDEQLDRVVIRAHPNQHLRLFGDVAENIAPHLWVRPVTVVELNESLLVTGDEPVVVVGEIGADHVEACFLTEKQRRRRLAAAMAAGREHRELVHFYASRPRGVATAEEVAIPLDPRRALVLGPKNTDAPSHVTLVAEEAREFADDLNARIAAQAYLWVVAHPDHPTFPSLTIPEPGPLVRACDGASPAGRSLNQPPQPRAPMRLRRTDWQR
jgi:hypothetical protein